MKLDFLKKGVIALGTVLVIGNTASAALIGTGTTLGGDTYNVDDGLFADPEGLVYGTVMGGGVDGQGYNYDPTTFNYNGATTIVGNGNARDYYWVQDVGNGVIIDNVWGGNPASGIIFNLNGAANKVVVFPTIDHDPLPGEALEHTIYLSNDLSSWTRGQLETVYMEGWDPNPNIADGWVGVYSGASGTSWRYASLTWGGASSIRSDGDTEIDAVAGLTEEGGGVGRVPEPSTVLLLGAGMVSMLFFKKKEDAKGI